MRPIVPYRRIFAVLLDLLPIDARCSIRGLAATVTPRDVAATFAHQMGPRVHAILRNYITYSIGYASNRCPPKVVAGGWSGSSAIGLSPPQIRACGFPALGASRG